MRKVKDAMEYLASLDGNLMFLAHKDFFHDHGNIYLGLDKHLLSLTEQGQIADKTILTEGLHQLIYGNDGYADEFFPKFGNVLQRDFVINPAINYGRISMSRLGVGADAVATRYKAGEKMVRIVEDYGVTPEEVIEAIRWHDRLAA